MFIKIKKVHKYKSWLDGWIPRVMVNGATSSCWPSLEGFPKVHSLQKSVLFIFFLEEDNECPLSNFADDSELDRNAGVLDGAMALQRVWDRLGGWSEANCMKFKKVKWCLLHFGPCSATGWGKSGSKASREGSWASGQQPR